MSFFKKLHHRREDRAKLRTRKELVHLLDQTFEQMTEAYHLGMKLIYQNPYLSKEMVIDSLDEDRYEIHRLLVLLRDAVNIAKPGTIEDDNDPYGNPYCD